jgi:hypothetical protein
MGENSTLGPIESNWRKLKLTIEKKWEKVVPDEATRVSVDVRKIAAASRY